jgi:hypothetical protein
MHEKLQIVVMPETFQLESKHVIGVIYFALDTEYAFPDTKWDDFVVVILGWWMEAGLMLLTEQERSVTLYFMDGSFHVSLEAETKEVWKLECVERFTGRTEIQHSTTIDSNIFLREVADAAAKTVKQCRLMNWKSSDLKILISKIDHFRSLNIVS